MRANAVILIVIGLLFLVGTVAAIIPDTVTITSDKSYVLAGSGDQSTITVIVTNTSFGPPIAIQGAVVNFSVNDPSLGTLNPIPVYTDINGKATNLFKVSTKSGFANISVGISYSDANGGYNKILYFTQKIDHNKAYYAKFQHSYEAAVGSNVTVNISFTDYYGNPIDQIINPLQQHTINLHVQGPNPNDCNFIGYGHDRLNTPLDQNGNVSVIVKLSSGAGENAVTMDQFELIPSPAPRIITGVSSEVFYMQQVFDPNYQVPADGNSVFIIQYTVFDRYWNPVKNQSLWVNTSISGEEILNQTDSLGHLSLWYGKKVTAGNVTIMATSVQNNTVTLSKEVEFVSTAPTTMFLTANPEYMPSYDIDNTMSSDISATITDVMGNPVQGEAVTFNISNIKYSTGSNPTAFPSLSSTLPILTDENGIAAITFIPGAFNATNVTSSTGNCTINATWKTTTKSILVTWKNYPYLSVTTDLNPPIIAVNDTVDITISLKGDGWALQPNPLDIVLVMDRSGSMGDSMGSSTKLNYAKVAATTFVSQMNQSRDRIGLVSYAGYTSGTDTRTDISPTHIYTSVNSKINGLTANGATETREAIKQSIDLLKANPNPNPKAIQAVILMTDGNFNWKGSPLAQGTAESSSYSGYSTNAIETGEFLWYSNLGCSVGSSNCQSTEQNLSIYAKDKNVRIYTIGFSANANDFDPKAITAMQILANNTGGFYSYAPDGATLSQIYTKIAGDLKTAAGVNTGMTTDFQNVTVNNASVSGAQAFDYVYNPSASTRIVWQDGNINVTNQSNDWAADNKLDFNIGTIQLGQTWQATFRLKSKMSGIIDIFGMNSKITFNNGSDTLTLPHTFLTVVPNLSGTGFGVSTISVAGQCSLSNQNMAIVPISWLTTYTGGPTTIFDEVSYIDDTGAHKKFYTDNYLVTGSTMTPGRTTFDMKTVPYNKYYNIEVRTFTSNNAEDVKVPCSGVIYNTTGKQFIKLQ
jgi:hypothetical protein